jgi:tetratricopeptide (TPR) repeat protein
MAAAALTGSVLGQEGALDPLVNEARIALENGAGALAISRLEKILKQEGISKPVHRQASLLLSQACLRAGNAERVGDLLKGLERDAEAGRWLAQATLQTGFWAEAASGFEAAAKDGADPVACALGRAEAFSGLGNPVLALGALEPFLDGARGGNAVLLAAAGLRLETGALGQARLDLAGVQPQSPVEASTHRYLEGRLWLAEGKRSEAAARFASLLLPGVEVPASVFVGAALGQCDILVAQGNADEAIKFLGLTLRSEREIPGGEPLFQRLAALLAESPDVSEEDFRTWARQGSPYRRALARFYLAQIYFSTGKPLRAAEELAQFCREFPRHPLLSQALLQRAEIEIEGRHWEAAAALLSEGTAACRDPSVLSQIALRQALVSFQRGRFAEALEKFDSITGKDSALAVTISYNAALTALRLGRLRRVQSELAQLRGIKGTESLVSDLELELALQLIRDGQPNAEDSLSAFLKAHPGHPRQGDARVALAELYFRDSHEASGTPKAVILRGRAGEYLQTVAGDPQSPRAAAQAEYLAVFLADAAQSGDDTQVIGLGESFLRNHPDSTLLPEMRMKLGELYLRRKDFANAETQFASLAKGQTEGPLVWTSLYLAGQCASALLNPGSVDRALGYWDRVVQGGGPLNWKARYQQAAVKSRLGEEAEGVVLFDLILAAQNGVDPDLKLSARAGKADAMLALARRAGGTQEEAIAEYKRLVETPGVTPQWRNQALYKIGKVLEGRQSLEEALEAFYRVLEAPGSAEAGEFFWLFKAGFDAARILEGKGQWPDAVALYERLDRMGGPRSTEAKVRARQLRLEHFLWE